MRYLTLSIIVPLFAFGYTLLAIPVFAQEINCSDREVCEKQLAELEAQIGEYEATVVQYQKQGKTLQGEIGSLNAKINKINLQIKSINLTLSKLDKEINLTKGEIVEAEDRLETNKTALTKILRKLYEDERRGLAEIMLQAPKLSDFFGNVNNMLSVKDALSVTVSKMAKLRNDLIDKKEELALKRSDAAALKAAQDAQKKSADQIKKEKNSLLTQTKGQESKFQSILKEKKKTAAEIRKRIFQFLGGGEMSFEEAYQFAKLAENATGVRAALILAVLDKESALGQNVGRCSYKEAMHPRRDIPIFLTLTAALNLNPDTLTVSCANRDGAYGGAMGPAQFIPSTWNLYQEKIASITGHNPPSPWNNGDAIVGTALYLQSSIKGCDSIYSKQKDIERCAAAKYYAGGRWRSHLWGYGERVAAKAQQFQQDIDTLNS